MPRPTPIRHVTATLARRSYAQVRSHPPPFSSKKSAQRIVSSQPPIQDAARTNTHAATFSNTRRLPWVISSIFAGIIGLYATQLYIAASKPLADPNIALLSHQKDVAARYDDTADSFDSEVAISEWLMSINRTRKGLASACKGHVLEASCGTGRNLSYFDIMGKNAKVKSLTFVDLSPQMVDVCKKKWHVLFGSKQNKLRPDLVVRFSTGSALANMPLPPVEGRKYDTIIQTMGLCSTPAPKEILLNMARHLDMQNEESRIFLLEHGRSYLPWLNRILDNSATQHAEIHGCWFNRDIGGLVEAAAEEIGLEIVRERRKHLGTTWLFELKPKQAKLLPPNAGSEAEVPSKVVANSAGWFGWSK